MPSSSTSSAAYQHRPGGSLKFKGGEKATSASSSKKKLKKKTKSSLHDDAHQGRQSSSSKRQANDETVGEHDTETPTLQSEQPPSERMTKAEWKFEQARQKRMKDRVSQKAKLSHKDRVDQFNKDLVNRTEHNDMLTVAGH